MSEGYYGAGTTFEQAPTGNHGAILVKVVDIGTQEGEYKGEKTLRRQEIWTWELPEEVREDGQPFIISKFYTASLGEKSNLYKDLVGWLGKAPDPKTFTPNDVLGKKCQVTVMEKADTGKRSVSSVSALHKSIKLPDTPHNPVIFFSLRPELFNQEIFDGLSDGVQKMIMKSPEYADIISGDAVEFKQEVETGDEEIPF
jgi:hypothetical protein